MKLNGQGSYLLPMHNHPLVVAQNILDSSALDVLECSIFLPKPSHETTLSRPLSRGKKWGDSSRQSGRKKDQRTANGLFCTGRQIHAISFDKTLLTYSKVVCLKKNIAKINYRGDCRSCNMSYFGFGSFAIGLCLKTASLSLDPFELVYN